APLAQFESTTHPPNKKGLTRPASVAMVPPLNCPYLNERSSLTGAPSRWRVAWGRRAAQARPGVLRRGGGGKDVVWGRAGDGGGSDRGKEAKGGKPEGSFGVAQRAGRHGDDRGPVVAPDDQHGIRPGHRGPAAARPRPAP